MTEHAVALREDIAVIQYEEPQEVVARATAQANALMDIVEKLKLYQLIGDKKYLEYEAWQTIMAFNKTYALTESVVPVERNGEIVGYRAKVNLVNARGIIVGSAEMSCGMDSFPTKGKQGEEKHKAAQSAAQTWAASKAARMNFSYIAVLGGYQPTPADEMRETAPAAPLDHPVEHWCEEHKTRWFKKGKMKGYAHPIGDTDKWCSEPEPKQGAPAKPRDPNLHDSRWLVEQMDAKGIPNADGPEALGMTLREWLDSGKTIDQAWAQISFVKLGASPEAAKKA